MPSSKPLVVRPVLPLLLAQAPEAAQTRFLEFFAAQLRNRHTRAAYQRAIGRFMQWCHQQGVVELRQIQTLHVAAYIEAFTTSESARPTVKQHLAAIRMLFDWLVTGQVVPTNPAAAVRGPKHVVRRGKTPVLTAAEAKQLIEAIPSEQPAATLLDLRDRALISLMLYSFARVSAICGMKVQDYHAQGKRWWLRLLEKGGKVHELPVHHKAEAALDAYLQATGFAEAPRSPLWRSADGRSERLTHRAMDRVDVYRMVRRRALAAGLPLGTVCCHTFRATGITVFLQNGGQIETAAQIAAHESPRTTKLYDRRCDRIVLEEIERIRL